MFELLKNNWIIILVTLLYSGAIFQYGLRGDWRTALVFFGYSVANVGTIALIVKGS